MDTKPFHFLDVGGQRVTRSKEPSICPHCRRLVQAQEVTWQPVSSDWKVSGLESIYVCPNPDCGHFFLATFDLKEKSVQVLGSLSVRKDDFELRSTTPVMIERKEFPPSVVKLSPLFAETYAQAEAAEAYGLTQICGLGYRKAVEYLIKDHCIDQHPVDTDKIKAMPLGACIKEFVTDPNVKISAQRAVWLGNDEAHYLRKWADKDIGDLKILIMLTSNWIDSLFLTTQYQDSMKP
ncbi:DUF4145 domain-containing protein [Variovorax sp. KBS0712]|uniref:DUF4145 domain-containing protein n=1 Tax=Variovorax sp. KBS0712 TaxID=2578111 RepID=UPI0011191D68|nr:DUF4145 domain-containing protein [Variovorax sp. KBS0712]TSD56383.1 DUF4145 domain-containing protein [Variovorax sp. KBS0712]